MKYLLIILSCFISSFMFAQGSSIEFYGGVDRDYRVYPSNDNEESIWSYHGGVNFNFKSKTKMTPYMGLRYALMGYKYEIKGSELRYPNEIVNGVYTPDPNNLHDDIKIVYGYSYIEMPIGVRYELGHSKWNYYGEMGLSPQLLLNKSKANGFGSKFNFALNLGFGFNKSINEKLDMFFKPNFAIQLFSIGGAAPIKEHLYRYGLEFGVSKKL